MKTEGQVRIPSGCAIAAVISRDGNKMSGEMITNAMKPMHDRSNGLGGGFARLRYLSRIQRFLCPASLLQRARDAQKL